MASTRKVKPQVVLMRRQKQLEDEQPLATVEIVERATAGVKGLAVADALRIWKALGSYVSAQLARGKAVKLEHLGLFALNASSEPIFLHNAVFLQTNRLRERTRHGSPGSLQAIGTAQCGSFSSVNMSEIGSRFLPNYSKEIVAAVIANVVAHVGNLAKQGRVLRLGFLPIGEWTCDGDVAGFKFLAEFYAQIKLQRTIRTVKMGVSDNGDVESPQESLSHNYEKEHQDLPRPRSSKAGSSPPVASMQLERHVSVVPSVRTTDFPSRSESSVSRSQANTRNSSRTPSTPSNRLQRTLTDDQSEAAISSRGALSLARVGSSSGRTSTKSTTRHNSQVSTKVIANKHRRSISGNESIVSSAGSRTRPSSKSSTKTREAWIEPSPENEAVVQRVKAKLMERCGQNGLNSLNQVLRLMDSSGDGKLSTKELKFGLRDIGIELTPSELLHVTIAFDRNEDGKIDLDEFLAALQGAPLNEKRRDLILKAFTLMDPNRSGVVSMDALRENYDVSLFPSVRAKKKSKQQALEEFLRQWEDRAAVENNDGITLDAFINYYHNISAFILDDSDFELLMRQTWHVSPSEDKESGSDQGNQRPTTSSQHSSSSRQSVISEAHRSTRTHEAKKMNSLNAEEMKNEKDQDLVETDWKYIKSLLIPAVYAPTSKPMTLDDMSRKLGANRVWGDGSEVMQGKVFAHALTLLDKQLTPKNALLLSHRVASYVTDGRNTAADGSIRLADFHCWLLSTQLRASISTSPMTESNSTNTVIDRVRNRLLQRVAQSSGSNTATHSTVDAAALSHIGLNGLQRSLRLIDANGDKRLTKDELKAGLRKFGVDVSFHELDYLFTFFDADRSGCVSVDEFLVGMRGEMSPRRLAFVTMAFDLLDKDGDGVVTLQELTLAYDTPKHPDVINGKLAAQDALRLFAAQWESEKERDGVITKLEFEEYYQNLSASIDSDEYFELMMRNAWHISGGEGACANSTNRRVLVTKSDNMQTVEEVKNDLGIRVTDYEKIHAKLSQQGVTVAQSDKNSKKPAIEVHYGTVVSTKKASDPVRSRETQYSTADSLAPPWQKKQMSARQHAAYQARQPPPGRLFHRRRVLDMESSVQTAAQNGYSMFPGQDNGYPDCIGDAKRSREQARNARQRAAQLIQSHFRGFQARKFVDCVRRKLEAEKQRQLQFQTQQNGNGTRSKVLRPALKAYHGF